MTAVTIGVVDDHIFVRDGAGADATQVRTLRLAVSGGVLDVPVDEATPGLNAEIWDAAAAAWWLPSVFGDVVTGDVLALGARLDAEESGIADIASRTDDDAPLADAVRRLALALWLRRWQPTQVAGRRAAFVPWLLDAEAATLAVDLNTVLSRDFPLAQALVSPHLAHLAAGVAAHHQRADLPGADAVIDGVIQSAALDALELVDPTAPGWSVLSEAVAARSRDESLVAESLAELDAQFALLQAWTPSVVAVTAGSGGGGAAHGSAPVDPRTVPGRVFSTEDDAISWTVTREADGTLRFDVEVESVGASPHAYFVRVDLGDDGDATPLEIAAHGYVATLWVQTDASPDDALVSVYGGIPLSDTLPNRPVSARNEDRREILRLVRLRMAAIQSSNEGAWNAPFAAEIANTARIALR